MNENKEEIKGNHGVKKGLTMILGEVLKVSPCKKTLNVVSIVRKYNSKYHKTQKRRKKYAVHSCGKLSEVQVGDNIKFHAFPPVSKTKRWILSSIEKRGNI